MSVGRRVAFVGSGHLFDGLCDKKLLPEQLESNLISTRKTEGHKSKA